MYLNPSKLFSLSQPTSAQHMWMSESAEMAYLCSCRIWSKSYTFSSSHSEQANYLWQWSHFYWKIQDEQLNASERILI